MTEPLAIGLIGAGPWARMMTAPVLAAGPQTRVSGVWSRTAEHARELGASLRVPAFERLDALFDTCEAVAIVVTPDAQPELAIAAARAGKTLLLEKPLAPDVAGAQAIVDATGAAGVNTLVMLTNRFDPRLDAFIAEATRIEPEGGRGCFISGAFLAGPFAHGWRLERGAVLDIGPHLLDLLEAGLGEIVAVQATGDPLGWVSLNCTHASGTTSSASMCCNAATTGRTELEVYSPRGIAFYDARTVDHSARADRIRSDLVAVAGGAEHPANATCALHLQRLVTDIERQLAGERRARRHNGPMTAPATVDELLALLARGAGVYDEPEVDGLAHALQCGAALRVSHPDDAELAVAGLVHDVADIVYPDDHGDHARRGAELVEPLLGPRVARLVAAHVTAKRYLVATDPGYRVRLSPRSVETLQLQGDALDASAVAALASDADLEAILALRRADEAAKDTDARPPPLDSWRPLLDRVAR